MKSYFGLAMIVVIGVGAYFYLDANDVAGPRQLTTLEHVGDECTLIAEKAAATLPEVLPFQKLEKAARQSRVLQSCMNDRGYMENPAWIAYAEPIAQQTAAQDKISVNEAYETLRRIKMLTFYEPNANTPLYWIPSKS